ncbi:MAG: hypothetical protein BAA01_06005 [Bacillus thermozeamaize]|uniref:Uncharacterized protein n=1 Tax=Bacillus thermozeamaize TaxID=230954 RepID=A0A1Y3PBI8_9BACI|nr:MAG: hypothetical protein BAA01_06005 [Bacillus thermozeamaize]
MVVYGFYGPSGTGKSYRALHLCHQLGIEDFIDDGLYIRHGRKVAGISAKYEQHRMAAIRRAIFDDPEHSQMVRRAIEQYRPEKLLIIGTSRRMIQRIAERLGLPSPEKWIHISEVAREEEIQQAQYIRKFHGQHVIPIPRIQVEKDRFQQLIERVKAIFDPQSRPIGENTIVYPRFQGGRILITQQCLKTMVQHVLLQEPQVHQIYSITIPDELEEPIQIGLSLYDGTPIPVVARRLQSQVQELFLQMLDRTIPPPYLHVRHLELRRLRTVSLKK